MQRVEWSGIGLGVPSLLCGSCGLFGVVFPTCSQAAPFPCLQGKSWLLDLSGKTHVDDLTLGLFVELIPHVQWSTVVWFNEAPFHLHRENRRLLLTRKTEANVSPIPADWLSVRRRHSLWVRA